MRPMRLLVTAVLVVGPASALAAAPAPARAATCSSSSGVSVVVDYRELGGGTVTACAADGGGKSAAAIFAEVGVDLSYAARQPGFVCRVNGVPTSDPCVNTSPTNAYWGLWWSDGTRPWGYSSTSVGGMTVPAGGSVGWAWQQDRAGQGAPPGVPAPTVEASTPSPTASPSSSASPSPSGTSSPTPTPTSPGGDDPTKGPRSGSTPSESPSSGSNGTRPGGTAGGEAIPSSSAEPSPTPSPDSDTAGPLPVESRGGSDPKSRSTKSPRDSRDGARPDEVASPDDDTSAAAGTTGTTGTTGTAGEADPPTRIPAALTWGIAVLLGVAILVSAVLSRRRRQG